MSLTKFTKAVNRIAHDVWASVMKHVASVCYEAHLTMGYQSIERTCMYLGIYELVSTISKRRDPAKQLGLACCRFSRHHPKLIQLSFRTQPD